MKVRTKRSVVVVLASLAAGAVQAQTLRWTSASDLLTLDPVAQDEALTGAFNGQIYQVLVGRDKQLRFVPELASEWKQIGPLQWRFKLREGVRFHDGRPFTADDVLFSVQRAKERTSQIRAYANAVGEPQKIDAHTLEFKLSQFDPVFLQHINAIFIMSKSWCEEHHATKPQDFSHQDESYASMHTNGTGPYQLVERQPGFKTVLKRNLSYWGQIEGNVQEVVYTPMANAATRVAALVSGEVDLVLDPPLSDIKRLRQTEGVKVIDGLEQRVLYIGMDQGRDQLLYSDVKGKNPFKDLRVRKALYQAIDIEAIKTKLMEGQAMPTGALAPSALMNGNDPAIEKRLPYDLEAAKKLLTEAGYPNGFEVTLDCPNNRYVNDERICVSLASMWAKANVRVRVNAMPKVSLFPKLERLDTSMYLFGWGSTGTDPEQTFTPIYRNRALQGAGEYNRGNFRNDKLDALAAASSIEVDSQKRKALIKQVFLEHNANIHHIPLHRQAIPWAARHNVRVVHRSDNWLELSWVNVDRP